nr:precorrin-6Y C5,15-methyltransferase (decarboxylating) subunit CbiT [Clostridioides difficile]
MRNSEFITGKVPITKEEVRAISISKLNLVNAKNLIDIGAGTGSVSVEAAYNYPNLKVISIEKNDDAIELIEKNIKKFNLKNIEVIKGCAPINLGLNVKVESIFLGGTGNNLEEIIEWSKKISLQEEDL